MWPDFAALTCTSFKTCVHNNDNNLVAAFCLCASPDEYVKMSGNKLKSQAQSAKEAHSSHQLQKLTLSHFTYSTIAAKVTLKAKTDQKYKRINRLAKFVSLLFIFLQ